MRSYFNFQAFENCGYIFSERSCLLFLLNMLSEIAFEQIEGNYWYAAYGPFRVVMMKDTGYINATKMCSSGGKKYKDWIRNRAGQEVVQALERKMAHENTHGSLVNSNITLQVGKAEISALPSPPCKFDQTMNSTDKERIISGTYIHPV